MGEVVVSATGLVSHVHSLLDNPMFSDVEISFEGTRGQSHRMFGHKLILALRSEHFASNFYKSEEKVQQVKVPDHQRRTFYLMMKFLYTDDVQFHTVTEAQDLYALADEYGVKELKDKCLTYLLEEKITIENVFPKYECALSKKIEKLLNDCRAFVCNESNSVFQSVKFIEVSSAVIEDIVKQDKLSVATELDVIFAVMKWARAECIRNKMDPDNKSLRECIEPFLNHLRFLSLTHTEFETFLQLYDVFSGYESNLITRKLLDPNCNVNMPKNMCCVSSKRGTAVAYIEKPVTEDLASNFKDVFISPRPLERAVDLNSVYNFEKPNIPEQISNNTANSNRSYRVEKLVMPMTSEKNTYSGSLSNTKKSNMPLKTPVKSTAMQQNSRRQHDLQTSTKQIQSNRLQFEITNIGPIHESPKTPTIQFNPHQDNRSHSLVKSTKFRSSFDGMDNTYPNYIIPNAQLHSNFTFYLSDKPPDFMSSFEKDIICSTILKMKSGNIKLYGFELAIKSLKRVPDEVEVSVSLKGFKGYEKPSSDLYKQQITKDTVTVMLPEPVLLMEGDKGELEVAIDRLTLKRCCSLDKKEHEINHGLQFVCSIFANSNHKLQDNTGFYFLINRLFYNRA